MALFCPPDVEKMKAKRDVNGLIKALSYDKDSHLRADAATALGEVKDARAVEPLITVLHETVLHKNYLRVSYVREAAEKALGQIGAPVVEPLIVELKDKNEDMRSAATIALGETGDTRAVEPLIAKLKDKRVNMWAAEALGKIGDTRAVEPLIALLEDGNYSDCKAAAEALRKIGWQPGQDENGARYWIAKGQIDKCIPLGALAVEPLIEVMVKIGREDKDVLWAAVKVLSDLYKEGRLDDCNKKQVLAHCGRLIKPHIDHATSCEGHTDIAAKKFPL